jgi:IS5 family transposase
MGQKGKSTAVWLQADKGYCSAKNDALLRQRGLRSGIQRKAYRGKPWSFWDKGDHKFMVRSRYTIARVLESIQRWLGRLEARYVGTAKTHGQHVLAAIAYTLIQTPGDHHLQRSLKVRT